jgi:DNA polymerase-1
VCIGYKFDSEESKVEFDRIPQRVVDALKDPRITKVGHNLPFDIKWLKVKGVDIVGPYYDTRIAYLAKHPFKDARLKTLMRGMPGAKAHTPFNAMVEAHKPKMPKGLKADERKAERQRIKALEWWEFVPKDVTSDYCKRDVDGTYWLMNKLGPVNDWVTHVEFPLIDAVVGMEMNGFWLDQSKVEVLHQAFSKEVAEIEAEFPTYAKGQGAKAKQSCVLTSPKALREHLVGLGLSSELSKYLTNNGEYSTDKLAMSSLAQRVPVGKRILRYRTLSKLIGTYTSKMRGMEVMRGTFNQVGTKTWRFSSSKPNLQQIPARSMEGLQVRSCFTARPGHKLVVSDLSQIEPRVYADMSRDPKLVDVFTSGKDFHSTVAKAIYGKDDITKSERFIRKTVGLATQYGAGAKTIQRFLQQSGVNKTVRQCSEIRNNIRRGFPDATKWSEDQWAKWDRFRLIRTIGGRRIHRDDTYKVNPVNYSIQPSCADIMKLILLNLHRMGYKIICTVHDEVVIEVPEHKAQQALKDVKDVMETSVKLREVPIVAESAIVANWAEAK